MAAINNRMGKRLTERTSITPNTAKVEEPQAVENKIDYRNPFKSQQANRRYKNAVRTLYDAGSKDPLGGAYQAVSLYNGAVKAAYEEGSSDPLQAGENYFSGYLKKLTTEASLVGKSFTEMMAMYREAGGMTSADKVNSLAQNGRLTQGTRMSILSGDTTNGGLSKRLDERAKWRVDNPDKIEDYLYVLENLPEIQRLVEKNGDWSLPEGHYRKHLEGCQEYQQRHL